jgi:type II secretory pathway pseudopilin PulG
MAADAIIALGVVAILATALAVSVSRQNLASQRLAEQRAGMRLAEQTILAMQTGQTPPTPPAEMNVSVRRLEFKGEMPAGSTWVTVTVKRGAHATELSGIVRVDSVKGAS